ARALGVVAGDVDPPDEDRTGGRLAQTEDGLSELALAVPADAGDPQDLARPDFEVDALERRGAAVAPRLELAHGKDHFIPRRRGTLHDVVQLAADHRARDLRRVRVLRDELPGVPPGAED